MARRLALVAEDELAGPDEDLAGFGLFGAVEIAVARRRVARRERSARAEEAADGRLRDAVAEAEVLAAPGIDADLEPFDLQARLGGVGTERLLAGQAAAVVRGEDGEDVRLGAEGRMHHVAAADPGAKRQRIEGAGVLGAKPLDARVREGEVHPDDIRRRLGAGGGAMGAEVVVVAGDLDQGRDRLLVDPAPHRGELVWHDPVADDDLVRLLEPGEDVALDLAVVEDRLAVLAEGRDALGRLLGEHPAVAVGGLGRLGIDDGEAERALRVAERDAFAELGRRRVPPEALGEEADAAGDALRDLRAVTDGNAADLDVGDGESGIGRDVVLGAHDAAGAGARRAKVVAGAAAVRLRRQLPAAGVEPEEDDRGRLVEGDDRAGARERADHADDGQVGGVVDARRAGVGAHRAEDLRAVGEEAPVHLARDRRRDALSDRGVERIVRRDHVDQSVLGVPAVVRVVGASGLGVGVGHDVAVGELAGGDLLSDELVVARGDLARRHLVHRREVLDGLGGEGHLADGAAGLVRGHAPLAVLALHPWLGHHGLVGSRPGSDGVGHGDRVG